jgi:hypothetical protein
MSSVAESIDVLGRELTTDTTLPIVGPWAAAKYGATNSDTIDMGMLLADLGTLAATNGLATLGDAVSAVRTELKHASVAGSGGISIFFPNCNGSSDLANYGSVAFARRNHWTDFLGVLNAFLLQGQARSSLAPSVPASSVGASSGGSVPSGASKVA